MVLSASKGISAKQVNLNMHQPPPCGWRNLKKANLSWEGWVTGPTPISPTHRMPPIHHQGSRITLARPTHTSRGVTNDPQKWVTWKIKALFQFQD